MLAQWHWQYSAHYQLSLQTLCQQYSCWRDSAVWSWGTSRIFKHNEFKVKSAFTKCIVSEMCEWCWWLAVHKCVVMAQWLTFPKCSSTLLRTETYIHLWNYFCGKMSSMWQFKSWISFSQQHSKTRLINHTYWL